MASSYAFCVVLLFVLFSATHNSEVKADGVDPLLPVCQTVGGGRLQVGIDFCVAALGSDKRSRDVAESYRNLSAIAVDLLNDNVTSTAAKIDDLLRQQGGIGGVAANRILLSCQSLYMDMVGSLSSCADAVKSGGFKIAQVHLRSSESAVKQCEAGFRYSHMASPVRVEDENAFKLAKLADGLLDHAT